MEHLGSLESPQADARPGTGVKVPNRKPGVYEVKTFDAEERLTIGKASNLRQRVKQGLVKGKTKHSTGKRIGGAEDVSHLLVRWAETDRPAAVEEELHLRHIARFGRLPKYTKHTQRSCNFSPLFVSTK
ncbi:MAG: hypothetical protein ACRD35_01015, partial [Candidatus Acidiferrales bacterium]